jgi:hypothetical protein
MDASPAAADEIPTHGSVVALIGIAPQPLQTMPESRIHVATCWYSLLPIVRAVLGAAFLEMDSNLKEHGMQITKSVVAKTEQSVQQMLIFAIMCKVVDAPKGV